MIPLSQAEASDLEHQLATGQLVKERVVKVALDEMVDTVCDATVEEDASFVADDIVVHNSEICRFLHGKVFSVSRGLATFEQVEANPEAIKTLTPWVRDGVDDKGRQTLFVDRGGGRTRRVAVVDKPAVGTRDQRGSYSAGLSPSRLQDIGISFPPLHGLCRSTTVADMSAQVVTPRVAEAVPK